MKSSEKVQRMDDCSRFFISGTQSIALILLLMMVWIVPLQWGSEFEDKLKGLIKNGKTSAAIKLVSIEIENGNKSYFLFYTRGSLYMKQRKYFLAINDYQEAYKSKGQSEVLRELVKAYKNAGKIEDAIIYQEKYMDKVKFVLNDVRALLSYYKKNGAVEEGAKRSLDYIHKLGPEEKPEGLLDIGKLYLGRGNTEKAKKILKRYLALKPNDEKGKLLLARANYNEDLIKGQELLRKNKPGAAARFLERAYKIKPDGFHAGILLANAYFLLRKYEKQYKVLDKVERLKNPNDPPVEVWELRGHAYYETGKLNKALEQYKKYIVVKENDVEVLRRMAFVHQSFDNYARAIGFLERAVSLEFESPEVHRLFGIISFKQGKYSQAVTQFETAKKVGATDIDEAMLRARAFSFQVRGNELFDEGKFDKAAEKYKEASGLLNDPKIQISLGSALIRQGKAKEAAGILKKTVKKFPDYGEAYLILAEAYRQAGKPDEAGEVLATFESKKGKPAIRFSAAVLAAERKDYSLSLKILGELIKEEPLSTNYTKERDRVIYAKGVGLYEEKKLDEADEVFAELVKLNPDHVGARQARIKIIKRKKYSQLSAAVADAKKAADRSEWTKAIELYKTILDLDPDMNEARYNLAILYDDVGKGSDSLFTMKQFLAREPDHFDANRIATEILVNLGRLEEGQQNADTLRALRPQSPWPDYFIGEIHFERGSTKLSVQSYLAALGKDRSHIDSQISLGRAYFKLQEYNNAEALFLKVIARFPDHKAANYNLGVIKLKKNKLNEALAQFKKSESLIKGYSGLNYSLAKNYYYLNEPKKALEYLNVNIFLGVTNIATTWVLANIKIKLAQKNPRNKKKLINEAKELLDICIYNKINNKISVAARRMFLALDRTKPLIYANRVKHLGSRPPAIYDMNSYIYGDGKTIRRIDTETEELIWKIDEEAPPSTKILVDGNNVFYGTEAGKIKCLDYENGSSRWVYKPYTLTTSIKLVSARPTNTSTNPGIGSSFFDGHNIFLNNFVMIYNSMFIESFNEVALIVSEKSSHFED